MKGKIVLNLVMIMMVLMMVSVTPVLAQSGDNTATETPTNNTTQNTSTTTQTPSNSTYDTNNIVFQVGRLTVIKEDLSGEEATIWIKSPTEMDITVFTLLNKRPNNGDTKQYSLSQGVNKITVPAPYDRYGIVADSEWSTNPQPNPSVWDRGPSSWIKTYKSYVGAIAGTLLGVVYVYLRKKWSISHKIRSIFQMKWW